MPPSLRPAPPANRGTQLLAAFLERRQRPLDTLTAAEVRCFEDEVRALATAGERSVHQVARMLGEARKWLREKLAAGELPAERLFTVLHPHPPAAAYHDAVRHSRAFDDLASGVAHAYRRGAQLLLLHLAARGRELRDLDVDTWRAFTAAQRALRAQGEPYYRARMHVAGARRFVAERIALGLVSARVLAEEPRAKDPWPPEWTRWLDETLVTAGLAANTRIHYRRSVRDFFHYLSAEGIPSLGDVTREVVTAYQLALQTRDAPRKGAPYAASTQVGMLAGLRTFFSYLVRSGQALADPTVHVSYPRAAKRLPRVLSVPVMRTLLRAGDDTPLGLRDRAMLELLYGSGLRGGELVRLTLADVDLTASTVLVREGKGAKDRMVPLGARARAVLVAYLEEARPALATDKSTALFVGCRGTFGARQLRRRLRELGQRLGVNLFPHVVRHTCATHLLKGRADIRQIQRLLGHESLATTERYTRVEVSDLSAVIRRCHPREKRS